MIRIAGEEGEATSLRAVAWNVERTAPNSRRTNEILSRINQHAPGVVCLTETHDMPLSQDGRAICSRPDCGSTIKEGRRKVMLWSREPWGKSMTWESIRRRPDGSCPGSQSSESAFHGSGHGLRPDASWNARCSGKTMNNIRPVSPKFSHEPHEEWAASGPSFLSSADPPVSRAIP